MFDGMAPASFQWMHQLCFRAVLDDGELERCRSMIADAVTSAEYGLVAHQGWMFAHNRRWVISASDEAGVLVACLAVDPCAGYTNMVCERELFAQGRALEVGVYYRKGARQRPIILAGLLRTWREAFPWASHIYSCCRIEKRRSLEGIGFEAVGQPVEIPDWRGRWMPMILCMEHEPASPSRFWSYFRRMKASS